MKIQIGFKTVIDNLKVHNTGGGWKKGEGVTARLSFMTESGISFDLVGTDKELRSLQKQVNAAVDICDDFAKQPDEI